MLTQPPPTCGEHAAGDRLPAPAGAPVAAGTTTAPDGSIATSSTIDGSSQAAAPLQVNCWACGVAVHVPMAGELPAPLFKCGWCGAVTEYMRAPPRSRPDNAFRTLMRILSNMKWGVVAAVVLLCMSIILPGAVFLLPQSCGFGTMLFYLNHMITWLLSFNTMYNFCAAIGNSAGTVKDCFPLPVQAGEPIPQGAFNDFRYCYSCKYFKPPAAHHCNICRTCVVDMDHHCPFINNCVGRANLRNFIAFLIWVNLSVLFAGAHSLVVLLVVDRPALINAFVKAWGMRRHPWDIAFMTLFIIMSTPWKTLVPLYIVSMGTGLYVGCGILLAGQLRFIWSEVTSQHQFQQLQQQLHLQSGGAVATGHSPLANGAAGTPGAGPTPGPGGAAASLGSGVYGGMQGLRHNFALFMARFSSIMGGPSPVDWLWPYWGPLPGVCAEAAKKTL